MTLGDESLNPAEKGCPGCRIPFVMDLTMAFQPIVDVSDGSVFAYEALVRGLDGAGAEAVIAQVTPDNRFAFDQLCRLRAVELSAALAIPTRVSINFMPNAVYQPASCLGSTLAAARRGAFPIDRIMFEVVEGERVEDRPHLTRILNEYKRQGFMTAIDDFGAGHAGLNLLAEFVPDVLKLDIELIRGVDHNRVRQAIVVSMVRLARDLKIRLVAEGIETAAEFAMLKSLGVTLMQGFLLARPAFEALPTVVLPIVVSPTPQRAA